jgi:hypothetical protein
VLGRVLRRANYANVTATIALFVALGGGAYAAVALPKNSVKARQIATNAVRASEIKRGGVGSAEVKDRSLRLSDFGGQLPAGPKGDQGSQGLQGPPGDSVFSYAHVNADGTFSPARSKDVLQTVRFGAGRYCVDFAGFDHPSANAKIAVATIGSTGPDQQAEIDAGVNGCSQLGVIDGDVFVRTYNGAHPGAAEDHEFSLLIVRP